MTTITIEEAQDKLSQLIDQLAPGEKLVITRNAQPIAQLIGLPAEIHHPVPGRGRGKLVVLSEDEDHLKGFEGDMS
ncbi:Antitoxin component of toxin-antitoxin stability system, DNA-binding transcriptional repressor [Singulisphaera sp. GP187]|uniref:type II toxin-antitoxin system Phd/YefM family antitoxin n=1 Tax=Singulisphaera sp. GP187 TaxID=1882752 RepID=UPI00092C3144|nr:type II toxin-antitoxin system Phd/YefM family antitoxin [Singulisphaera sp. GP187]SIN79787.1 Antitoxin component of toxin-antitoxin stability system, DNA-binding transcriptional repressor [Singulisphaera sp. GP187]